MVRIFIGFMICFLLLSCAKKEEKAVIKNKPYIISYEDEKLQKYSDSLLKSNSNLIAIPKRGIYGESQLIIDNKGSFYFYQRENIRIMCGTRSPNDTLPHLIGLKPNDIVRIPQKSLNDFLSENILTREKNERILTVASQCDTIKNISFFNFINENKIDTYLIRRTTQEEDTVLKYKKSNHAYYSEDIKWDQNRITLPFVKPKLKNK